MATENADVVVGIKSAHWWAPNFLSVQKAVEAGKLAGIPVMVDFGYFLKERPYQTMVTDILRPGDMSTHCFRWPAPLLDSNEKPAEFLLEARRRGVKFDVGHGGGSFHFRLAEPLVKAGFYPDSISTDMHTQSMNAAMQDMPTTMSKFLAMGMPLVDVVRASTANPAAQVKRPELGQIAVGADADIAVFRLDQGEFGFTDVAGGRITGRQRLACEMTLRSGRIVFDYNGRAGVPWRTGNLRYPEK
jgi:dihydroorotase